MEIEILWPEISADELAPQAKNNDSLVMFLRYGERTALLPGDADVLKVAHHGSKNSTMPEFLSAVTPQVSIISAGEENPYGHPSGELPGRLEESGSRVFRTDLNGAVQVLTDGHTLQVSCFTGCPAQTIELAKTQPPDHKESGQQ